MSLLNPKFRHVIALLFAVMLVSIAGCGGGGSDSPVAGDGTTTPGGDDTNPGDGDNTGGGGTDPDDGIGDEDDSPPPADTNNIPKSPTANFGDSEADAIEITSFVSNARLDSSGNNDGDPNDPGAGGGGGNDGDDDVQDPQPNPPIQPDPGDDYDTFSLPFGLSDSGVAALGGANPRLKVLTLEEDCGIVFEGYELIDSCTGDIPIETNFDEFGGQLTRYPEGAYLAYSFADVSVITSDGLSFDLSGDYRFTVKGPQTAQVYPELRGDFYLDTVDYIGLNDAGERVGPISGRQDVTFHNDGTVSIILKGARYREYRFIRGSNDQTYFVESGSMISRFRNGYAQVDFSGWDVVDGVPQVDSLVFVSGANGESGSVEVTSVSATEVVFTVLVSAGDINREYNVTATITPDGLRL